jgi:hypothetical protein
MLLALIEKLILFLTAAFSVQYMYITALSAGNMSVALNIGPFAISVVQAGKKNKTNKLVKRYLNLRIVILLL